MFYELYNPLQKKCNAWFRGSHAPSFGSATPGGQVLLARVGGSSHFFLIHLGLRKSFRKSTSICLLMPICVMDFLINLLGK